MTVKNNCIYTDDGSVLLKCPKEAEGRVVIPEGTLGIKEEAFKGCKKITSVVFPHSLKKIGRRSFQGCKSIFSIKLPENVNHIGEYAFKSCVALRQVSLPSQLTELKRGVFEDCMMLSCIKLSKSGIQRIEDNCFKDCYSLEKFFIPKVVTFVGKAFVDCMHLKKVTIESGCTAVDKDAFRGCAEEMTIMLLNVSPEIYNSKYNKKSKSLTSSRTKTIRKIQKKQFSGKHAITTGELQLWLPEGIESIEESGFQGSTTLIEISTPTTMKKIGMYAFAGCTRLETVTIKEGVEYIGSFAFRDCKGLKSLDLPDSLKTIGKNAFAGCENLERISMSRDTEIADDDALGVPMSCIQIR